MFDNEQDPLVAPTPQVIPVEDPVLALLKKKKMWASKPVTIKPKPAPVQALVPLSKEEWDNLNEKGRWDIMVALRGPDLRNSDTLKWFTTSVIRWKMHEITHSHGLVNQDLPFVVMPGFTVSDSTFAYSHFLGHIHEAANWLSIPTIHINKEIWELILKSNRVVAGAYLWDTLGREGTYADAIKQSLLKNGYSPEFFLKKEDPDATNGQ